ncbi:hypothetical protein CROQUDRAFT_172242 [Cronartium quercuum f. sp. fusiforme G11]|uniref:Uncharacterized protein n=1 Tax=Cronartium quercuum f. sp. fusiforme G11 TaxID=708437 RepID=A0A9P6T9J3_9BASI|nr:hypothetical protein CROQUDRAFT_172242 [Cronartium quercuum f. sp. fusiforme G11]
MSFVSKRMYSNKNKNKKIRQVQSFNHVDFGSTKIDNCHEQFRRQVRFRRKTIEWVVIWSTQVNW